MRSRRMITLSRATAVSHTVSWSATGAVTVSGPAASTVSMWSWPTPLYQSLSSCMCASASCSAGIIASAAATSRWHRSSIAWARSSSARASSIVVVMPCTVGSGLHRCLTARSRGDLVVPRADGPRLGGWRQPGDRRIPHRREDTHGHRDRDRRVGTARGGLRVARAPRGAAAAAAAVGAPVRRVGGDVAGRRHGRHRAARRGAVDQHPRPGRIPGGSAIRRRRRSAADGLAGVVARRAPLRGRLRRAHPRRRHRRDADPGADAATGAGLPLPPARRRPRDRRRAARPRARPPDDRDDGVLGARR